MIDSSIDSLTRSPTPWAVVSVGNVRAIGRVRRNPAHSPARWSGRGGWVKNVPGERSIGRVRRPPTESPTRRAAVRIEKVLGDRASQTLRRPPAQSSDGRTTYKCSGRSGAWAIQPRHRPLPHSADGARIKNAPGGRARGRVSHSPAQSANRRAGEGAKIVLGGRASQKLARPRFKIPEIANGSNYRRNRRRVNCALFKWQFRRFRRFAIAEIATRRLTRAIFWRFQ